MVKFHFSLFESWVKNRLEIPWLNQLGWLYPNWDNYRMGPPSDVNVGFRFTPLMLYKVI
jgi:hypothetical protein